MGKIKNTVSIVLEDDEADSFWRRFLSKSKVSREGMDQTDRAQQDQIERLQQNSRLMFAILLLNTLAAVAQIVECITVWRHAGRL